MADVSFALTQWSVARTEPAALPDPVALAGVELPWVDACIPGTVASALRESGTWTVDDQVDFDASDWWFRTRFGAPVSAAADLCFEGIATMADVWLNGEHVLTSDNMFVASTVTAPLQAENELVVCCRSLRQHLSTRRPRPRWKTKLVELQQLRWVRTTFLGRMPSWTPPAAPVGMWRPVTVHPVAAARISTLRAATSYDGRDGTFEYAATIVGGERPVRAQLAVADHVVDLDITEDDGDNAGWVMAGTAVVSDVGPWFPATHGEPVLHPASIRITTATGDFTHSLAPVGFRTITVDDSDGGFALLVNGVPIFARGAVWTPADVVSLQTNPEELRATLDRVAGAGLNLLRVPGTAVYEHDDLYARCDGLGIMVWQDLMFANLDYPIGDAGFAASVHTEVRQNLARLALHPSVAVVCGGSEVEQQAAMMGLDPTTFENELGRTVLPAIVRDVMPGMTYVPCSPSGGTFPFSPAVGVSHYYGVGAYRRLLTDARRADVRFVSECLAFANVPNRAQVDEFIAAGHAPGHSPGWKARVPRDRGAGWDFEDIRDFYVRELFGEDPFEVRATDTDRYLDLGRAAVHATIEATISEWRRPGSSCSGAIVLMLRDLWPGAGWGVLDTTGAPKSAFDALARTCAPTAVLLTDEGLNGLYAHLVHDRPQAFEGMARVRCFGPDGQPVANAERTIELAAHGSLVISVDEMLGGFRDLTNAYRFGPSSVDVVSVQLVQRERVAAEAMYLVGGLRRELRTDLGLQATGRSDADGLTMHVATRQFAQFVSIDVPGHSADDNWFHLAPGDTRTIRLTRTAGTFAGRGEVRALNQRESHAVKFAAAECTTETTFDTGALDMAFDVVVAS